MLYSAKWFPGFTCGVLLVLWTGAASVTVGATRGATNAVSGVPAGYDVLAAQGSGRTLFIAQPGVKSAKSAVLKTLRDLTKLFDAKPAVGGAFGDDKDRQCQAAFTAKLKGQLVQGRVSCGIGEKGAAVTVVYDRADAPPAEVASLLEALPVSVKWVVHQLPGGSGSISLPSDWKLTGSNMIGMVTAEGSAGQTIGLGVGAQVIDPHSFVAAQAKASGTMLVAPFSDPVTAMKVLTPQLSQMSQRRGGPAIRLDKIISSTPDTPQVPQGQAAWIYLAATKVTGSTVEHVREWSHFECYPVGPIGWAFNSSFAAAPDAIFDRDLPLMVEIGKTWKLNGQAIQANTRQIINAQNQQFAAFEKSMQERNQAFERFMQSSQNAERVREKANADFDEVIRGSRTVEETLTGERREMNLGYSKEIVDKLNEKEGYNRYKEIPLRDQF